MADKRSSRIHKFGFFQIDTAARSAADNVPVGQANLRSYFKQLERRFLFGMLLAFVLPLACLSAYFHFQFNVTLKETGKLNLSAIAESQRNTVDLFIQERLVNIFSLFHSSAFSLNPAQEKMEKLLQQLQASSNAFIDVGFLNDKGLQIGYAGPYPYLQNQDYSRQAWFVNLLSSAQNHAISDIYLGFRNKLHFTIAAKQVIDDRLYVLRATLDPEKFYLYLKTISHAKGVESVLINHEGQLQLYNPQLGAVPHLVTYVPPRSARSGANVIDANGDTVLVAHAWLSDVSWALLVNEPLSVAYAQFYRARRIMLISTTVLLLVVVTGIWSATRALIGRARENAEQKEELADQLLHAGKLAALGELATGVAHEINNPLAIVVATTGVIKDMLNPEFNIQWTVEDLRKELQVIDSAVFRARGITQQLLNFGHKNEPRIVATRIDTVLEEVLGGLKERALTLANIDVVRRFDADLPNIDVDPDQMRQVFLNLINNAGDAIDGRPGTITISIHRDGSTLRIGFADTGKGMAPEQIKKIFDPFFTTKEVGKGTGLGLSVSIGIVESMGGSIEVQSTPGAGSQFTVVLPIRQNKGAIHVQ